MTQKGSLHQKHNQEVGISFNSKKYANKNPFSRSSKNLISWNVLIEDIIYEHSM